MRKGRKEGGREERKGKNSRELHEFKCTERELNTVLIFSTINSPRPESGTDLSD